MGGTDRGELERIPDKLAVGMALTNDPRTTLGLLEQFCLSLGDATGLEVTPRGVWHYEHLLSELRQGAVHVVWLPPIVALQALADDAVVPIALPLRDGSSTYRAALFSRADSGIETVADLHGVSAAWVDQRSAAGYLIIRAHLRRLGVDLGEAFATDRFLGTHDGVAQAVRDGEAQVGATFVSFDPKQPRVVRRAGWGSQHVRIVAASDAIPSDVVAVAKGVPSLVRRLVQSALVEVQNPDLQRAARTLLGAEGFVAPPDDHLEPLRALAPALGSLSGTPHSMFPGPPSSDAPL